MNGTMRQCEAWDAVKRLGTQQAAADELGISQPAVAARLDGYMVANNIIGKRPGGSSGRKPGRPDATMFLVEEMRQLKGILGQTQRSIRRIEAKLDGKRPAKQPSRISHRRIADGGQRVA